MKPSRQAKRPSIGTRFFKNDLFVRFDEVMNKPCRKSRVANRTPKKLAELDRRCCPSCFAPGSSAPFRRFAARRVMTVPRKKRRCCNAGQTLPTHRGEEDVAFRGFRALCRYAFWRRGKIVKNQAESVRLVSFLCPMFMLYKVIMRNISPSPSMRNISPFSFLVPVVMFAECSANISPSPLATSGVQGIVGEQT